ncbi:Uncharacterised protein r2_g1121 [Pycnogonum litorale]
MSKSLILVMMNFTVGICIILSQTVYEECVGTVEGWEVTEDYLSCGDRTKMIAELNPEDAKELERIKVCGPYYIWAHNDCDNGL